MPMFDCGRHNQSDRCPANEVLSSQPCRPHKQHSMSTHSQYPPVFITMKSGTRARHVGHVLPLNFPPSLWVTTTHHIAIASLPKQLPAIWTTRQARG